MTAYRITATGTNGTEFVYEIDGDDTTTAEEATIHAYYLHGKSVREGLYSELLGPHRTVEEI